MDPTNGDILAMATYPDYNLNTPFEPNTSLKSSWDSLSTPAQSTALQKMWRNKAVSDAYEPGSTFKVITASAALEEGIVETDTIGDLIVQDMKMFLVKKFTVQVHLDMENKH